MYYPYLRGRQNELLALKELLQQGRLSDKIIPIVEPVKLNSTLINAINSFILAKRKMIIINNPQIGAFAVDCKNLKNKGNFEKFQDLVNNQDYVIRGIIANKHLTDYVSSLHARGIGEDKIAILCLSPDYINAYKNSFSNAPYITVVPYMSAFRRVKGNRVLLEDNFNKRPRNADYADHPDEFFSELHLSYEGEYTGFSDYSIIGEEFNESGFVPYAVAIHIVYFDEEKNMRIHHFVSHDREDMSDVGGKYYQALEQLMEWKENKHFTTIAMKKFEESFEHQTYPGLGMVKRWSIMHHLELMGNYLDGK